MLLSPVRDTFIVCNTFNNSALEGLKRMSYISKLVIILFKLKHKIVSLRSLIPVEFDRMNTACSKDARIFLQPKLNEYLKRNSGLSWG